MPFTFSHPAIVLPLYKASSRYLSLTGLIIGSMTPDFEYFMRLRVLSIYSHTWYGILWFDLPLALFVSFIFHLSVRKTLIRNLPDILFRRFGIYADLDWKLLFENRWMQVVFSCILGILSHILWDGFTHKQGFTVTSIPALQGNWTLGELSVPVYRTIQHVSTLLGGITIVYYLSLLPTRKVSRPKPNSRFWMLTFLITLVVLGLRFSIGTGAYELGNWVVSAIAGSILGLFISSYVFKLN
jgi:hypothetical protein